MKTKPILLSGLFLLLFAHTAFAQQTYDNRILIERYGTAYDEVIEKADGDFNMLQKAEEEQHFQQSLIQKIRSNPLFLQLDDFLDSPYVERAENEPNNFFDEADSVDDVLSETGVLSTDYFGKLVTGEFDSPEDVDVYAFTVDTTMMYYFNALHGTAPDGSSIGVNMRLFHESDLDTTVVEDFQGITGNDQMSGDILGRNTDGRGGAGLFRLTGWSSPINPDTGEQLTGTFYLWVFNDDGDVGHYNMTAYAIPFEDWVNRKEPDYPQSALLTNAANPDYTLNSDAVPRSFMMYNPDTVKTVIPKLPSQSNSVYPQLLAEGDEDVDLFFISYKQDHNLVVETIPYFGWYRTNEGDIGSGSTRMTDMRNRLYDGDFSQILLEDDDGARERHDGPNNIHSRMVMTPEQLEESGLNENGPLILWVGAWASNTRTLTDPNPGLRSVDNRDPGRGMYKVYAYQYHKDRKEFEPNDLPEDATPINAEVQLLSVQDAEFSGSGDTDMYRVFMHELRMYTLFTTNSTVSEDIDIKIYHESATGPENAISMSGDLVAENGINVKREGNDLKINGFIPENTGAYLIELSSGSPGEYNLGVLDKGQIFEGRISNEPDDTFADATTQEPLPIGPGAASQTAMIYPAADVDHFYFNAEDEFNISLSGTSSDIIDDFDAKITLLDDVLNEIKSSTNGNLNHVPAGNSTFVVRVEAENDGAVGFYTISGGEPFEESEPNDSFATNTPAAVGQLYESGIDDVGDVDFFSFELKEGSLYSFRSVDNETGAPLDVEFFDAENGETLMDDSGWVDNYSGDNFKIANIIPQEDGIYYLKISGNAGPYKILSKENPEFSTLAEKHEPDNSIEEAKQLGPTLMDGTDRTFVQFNADSARFYGDLDYFMLDLKAGQNLSAETKPVGGITTSSSSPDLWNQDTDTRLRLFDSDGNELLGDDDGGNGWYSLLEFTADEDGEYFLQVANSRGPGGGDDRSMRRGDYILNVAASFTENEPNNTFTGAEDNPLGDRSFSEAEFEDGDDTDIFKLSMEGGKIYHLRSVQEDGVVMQVELYESGDLDTNLLEDGSSFNTRYGDDNFKINFIPESSGDYFLKLTPPETVLEHSYNVYMKSNSLDELTGQWESNNTIAEAAERGDHPGDGEFYSYMLYDESVEGFHDDLDYYQVTAAAGDTITAETAPFDGELWPRDFDAYMYLFDSEGNELASNDDGGFDWHSKISYEVEEAGSYYFLVIGQDAHVPPRNGDSNRIRDPARGEYKLAVSVTGLVGVSNEPDELVYEFELGQNYPNPFNPATNIQYSISKQADVKLEVYNVIGQRVAVLVNQMQSPGQYTVNFDASSLASGLYFYRLQSADQVQTKKMMLIK
ncbi:MAG: T9SS type A sorting domain-containing protein [Bacteroidetes bacterium]|jgi:hypothetical protein|nr:T9SS type A sorting domain-containing protein [Bacteroidota bacterium]